MTPAAQRQRRHRERLGRAILRVEVDVESVTAFLVSEGLLCDGQEDPYNKALQAALERAIGALPDLLADLRANLRHT